MPKHILVGIVKIKEVSLIGFSYVSYICTPYSKEALNIFNHYAQNRIGPMEGLA